VYGRGGWECSHIQSELERTDTIYPDNVSPIRMPTWTRGRIALVGDAAFCVSPPAGQGSALAMISANVMAGELAAAHGEHQEAFGKYEVLLGNHIGTKQKGAKRFACRLRAENTGRPVPPQPNHSGL
jgi:flavin-dependent dehydrogenase